MKKDRFNSELNFWELAFSLCLGGILIACSIGYVLQNFVITNQPQTEIAAESSVGMSLLPTELVTLNGRGDISSDFEADPKPWWINGEHTYFELKNSTRTSHKFSVKFRLQKNPCGFRSDAEISYGSSIIQLVEGRWIPLTGRIEPGELILLPLTLSTVGCSISSDPRIFFGALSTSMKSVPLNHFDFES